MKKIKKIILLSIMFLILLPTTLSFAVLPPNYYKYVNMQGINISLWVLELILIIFTCIRKRDINKIYALLFMIWTFSSLFIINSRNIIGWYFDSDFSFDYDYWYIYIPGIILGAIIVIYTIKVNFRENNKTLKGEEKNVRND